jgi:hypothetical protein
MDYDGGRAAHITPQQVKQWVDYANSAYTPVGVRLDFDPNDPREWSTLPSTLVNGMAGDGDRNWVQERWVADAVGRLYPGQLTVLFRWGPDSFPTGAGFSWSDLNFVAMPGFNDTWVSGHQNISLFAHEVGHYLGLSHTFTNVFSDVGAAEAYFRGHGDDPQVFDGDGLSDTPPDPFSLDMQGGDSTSVILDGVRLTLPRTNIMSYYDSSTKILSPQQGDRVRQTYLNRALGPVTEKYVALGALFGFLGAPVSPELVVPDASGVYRHFQGGSVYWSPATGAHEVHGLIRAKWASLGWERSFLGYPLTDETATPDGIGRYNHFQGGSVYWTPTTGAHEVHGYIRSAWASLGWEWGFLGYPVTDEMDAPGGRVSYFQHGSIYWNAATGAVTVTAGNVIHVHAIRVSDSNGSFAADITPAQVNEFVSRANAIYAAAKIQFAFNPGDAQDFSTVASDPINRMYYGGSGYNPAADPAQGVAAQFRDQLTVFFRRGYEFNGDGTRGSTGNGFSGKNYNYVAMPGYTPWQLGLFAHETGHFLGLRHTFVGDSDRVTDTPARAVGYILSHGGTAAALDGDNVSLYPGDDPVTDTNPDPGTYYYTHYVSSDPVNGPATFTLTAGAPSYLSWTFTPPCSNVMSYYNWADQTVTPDQTAVMNKWYRMRFVDHTWRAGAYVIGNSGNGGEDDTDVHFADPQGSGGHGGGCGCPFCQARAAAASAVQASLPPNSGSATVASARSAAAVQVLAGQALFVGELGFGIYPLVPERSEFTSPRSLALTDASFPSGPANARPAAPAGPGPVTALAIGAAGRVHDSGTEAAFWEVFVEENDRS